MTVSPAPPMPDGVDDQERSSGWTHECPAEVLAHLHPPAAVCSHPLSTGNCFLPFCPHPHGSVCMERLCPLKHFAISLRMFSRLPSAPNPCPGSLAHVELTTSSCLTLTKTLGIFVMQQA